MNINNDKNINTPSMREFDLNLLEVFDAVYVFKSVTLAAAKLNRSSSAISQTLNKLRKIIGDPLFVRDGMSLSSTIIADNFYINTHSEYMKLMQQIDSLVYDKHTSRINVMTYHYSATRIIPLIGRAIDVENLNCKIVHVVMDKNGESPEEVLMRRKADVLLDVNPIHRIDILCIPLWEEKLAFVCRKNHPRLGDSATIEELRGEQFSIFDTSGSLHRIKDIQYQVDSLLPRDHFALRSDSVFSIAAMVEHTDIIAVLPYWLFNKFKDCFSLKEIKTDIPLPSPPMYMMLKKNTMDNSHIKTIINNVIETLRDHPDVY